MNVECYRVVLKTVELCNITKAAEDLGYTQSGVSHIISKVEEEFRKPIFIRSRNGVSVSPSAKPHLDIMRKIVDLEDQLYRSSLHAQLEQKCVLRISAFHTVAFSWLPGLMQDFLLEHPDVIYEAHEKSHYPYIVDQIESRSADIGFIVGRFCKGLDFHPLYQDQYYVVFPVNHPLSQFDEVAFDMLKPYPMVVPDEAMHHKRLRDNILSMDTSASPLLQTLDDRMTLSLVEQGFGISIIPGLFLHNHRYRLQARLLQGDFSRMIGIGIRKDSANDPMICKFIKFAKKWLEPWQDISFSN